MLGQVGFDFPEDKDNQHDQVLTEMWKVWLADIQVPV